MKRFAEARGVAHRRTRGGRAGTLRGLALSAGVLLSVLAAIALERSWAQSGDTGIAVAVAPTAKPSAAFPERMFRPTPPPSAPAEPPADPAELRRTIEAANAAWLAAFRRGDTAELANRYTPDAHVIPPDGKALEGRERIAAYFAARRDAGLADLALHTVDVLRVGELAYETGTWTSRRNADAGLADTGRYFAIWKAGADGSWTCKVGTWNAGREPVPAR